MKRKKERKKFYRPKGYMQKLEMIKIASNFDKAKIRVAVYTMLFKGKHFSSKYSRNECKYFTQGCLRLSFLTKRERSQKSVNKLSARGDKKT